LLFFWEDENQTEKNPSCKPCSFIRVCVLGSWFAHICQEMSVVEGLRLRNRTSFRGFPVLTAAIMIRLPLETELTGTALKCEITCHCKATLLQCSLSVRVWRVRAPRKRLAKFQVSFEHHVIPSRCVCVCVCVCV